MGVVTDIGATEIGNSGNAAPVPHHIFFVAAEFRFVRQHVAPSAQTNADDRPNCGVAGYMKEGPVDPVHVFGYVFDHQHMAGKVGLPWRADQMAQYREVEWGHGLPRADMRLKSGMGTIDKPGQRAQDRSFAARAQDVRRHRAVCKMGKSEAVKTSKQRTRIAVTEIALGLCVVRQSRQDLRQKTSRSVATPAEPDSVE